jgi:drug/metabolite transporter (DMT)-like permease
LGYKGKGYCKTCQIQLENSGTAPWKNKDNSEQNQPQQFIVHKPFIQRIYEFYHTPTFWWIAGIVGIMDLVYLYFYFFEREKLKEKLAKNTPLKIFSYLLAIASVIILIIPVLFLLGFLGGGNERVCSRCHRKSGNCCC